MTQPLVLVCDDTANIANIISLQLQAEGYNVLLTTTALEAFSLARKEAPALILMDVMMPGMDGAMASELMHDAPGLEGVPVVLISAMPEDELRERAQACGVQGYLAKPFTKQTLLDTVRKHARVPISHPQTG